MSAGLKVGIGLVLAACGVVLLFSLAFIHRPVRRLLSGALQGLCALAAVNILAGVTGVSLGLNVYSGTVCCLLGLPGVVSLLLAEWLLGR
ncbi:MAG: pro-sigmaK processing inhibitor BofA family protein [Clostridia bacterium]|nr:pro-sigmaK processing inhibitor BofA family protein [Clostridia bacterium]